jgi:hypothetical protein
VYSFLVVRSSDDETVPPREIDGQPGPSRTHKDDGLAQPKRRRMIIYSEGSSEDDCGEQYDVPKSSKTRGTKQVSRKRRHIAESDQDDQLVPLKSRRKMNRVPWCEEDLNILWKAFKHCKKAPNAADIKACVRDNPSLSTRTLPQIKTRAWALIVKRRDIK